MISIYRKTFFTLFAAFFTLSVPLIIFLSLGYKLDLQEKGFENSLSAKIETFPQGATIKSKNKTFKTPVELGLPNNKTMKLSVSKKDYLNEEFVFWTPNGVNLTVQINDLWLLPSNSILTKKADSRNILTLLNKDLALLEKNNKYYLKKFTFSGFLGQEEEIKYDGNTKISAGRWQTFASEVYWQPKQKLVLYRNKDGFLEIFDLKTLEPEIEKLVYLEKSEFIVLDKNNNIWHLKLDDTKNLTFLETNILGLVQTKSPENIWILRKSGILAIKKESINPDAFILPADTYLKNNYLVNKNKQVTDFQVLNIFLGLAFMVDSTIVYVPDSNPDEYKIITNEALLTEASTDSIFWLDLNGNIHTENLLLDYSKIIGKVDLDFIQTNENDTKKEAASKMINEQNLLLYYHGSWNRVFLYSKDQIWSAWYSHKNKNTGLVGSKTQNWIKNTACYPQIVDGYQFCQNKDSLIFYRNNTITF